MATEVECDLVDFGKRGIDGALPSSEEKVPEQLIQVRGIDLTFLCRLQVYEKFTCDEVGVRPTD